MLILSNIKTADFALSAAYNFLAERSGFEPEKEFPPYTLSRRAPSTTRPSLR